MFDNKKKLKIYNGHMLSEKEKRLMQALFYGNVTEEDIVYLTKGLDVDTANSDYMLMLSYLGYSNHWKWFPKEMIPRLQGLHRYYQVRNALGMKGLLERIDLLSLEGIPVMLIKGVALRYYYTNGVPRIMSDIDLLVPEHQYEQAIKILCDSGGKLHEQSMWSVHVLNGPASIDLHKWLFKNHGEKNQGIWERAVPMNLFGRKVYVPSAEDMFVHLLDSRARAIFVLEAVEKRMRWLYDCRKISMQKNFDWMIVAQRIKEFQVDNNAYFMMKAFSDCFPEIVSEHFVEENVTPAKDYEAWMKCVVRNRRIRDKCEKAKKKGSLVKYALLWPRMRYMDYRLSCFGTKVVEGKKLTFLEYFKRGYQAETLGEVLKILFGKMVSKFHNNKKGNLF